MVMLTRSADVLVNIIVVDVQLLIVHLGFYYIFQIFKPVTLREMKMETQD